MRDVVLVNSVGELVTNGIIPPFITPPDVIMWGTRIFQIDATQPQDSMSTRYKECFAF